MTSRTFIAFLPHRFSHALAGIALGLGVSVFSPALWAGPIALIANESSVLKYPNSGPTSIANETQETPADLHSASGVTLTASLNETRSGTDSSSGTPGVGTYGVATIAGTTTAEAGHIVASSSASVLSIPDAASDGRYPHGTAVVEGFGRFSDVINIFNPNYGGLVPVTLHLDLDWTRSYNLGTGGSNFVQDFAFAQMGLDFFGSVSLFNLGRSDVPGERVELQGIVAGDAYNNNNLNFWGSLDVQSIAALNVQGTVASLTGSASAFSMGNAYFTIEAPEGTVITSTSGHDYRYHAAQSVPESATTLWLLALATALVIAVRPRVLRPVA